MTTNVNFDEIDIGDPLPEWSRTTGFMEWNRYAAINDEFVPFHMDDAAGRKAGNEQGAFGMGNLRYAYIVNALKQWIGDEAEIREVGCQYRATGFATPAGNVSSPIRALTYLSPVIFECLVSPS